MTALNTTNLNGRIHAYVDNVLWHDYELYTILTWMSVSRVHIVYYHHSQCDCINDNFQQFIHTLSPFIEFIPYCILYRCNNNGQIGKICVECWFWMKWWLCLCLWIGFMILVTWVNIENTLECMPNLTDTNSWATCLWIATFCECITSSQCII